MLAARDASEAEEISERARRERQQRREQGRWHGGNRPFGWEPDGVTPRPVEQGLIRRACDDVLAGRSLAAISRAWSAALGRHVRSNVVGDILRNPRVAGRLPDGRPARWPAVVPEETWRGVVAVLADPARRTLRGPTRLLTGIAACGICGAFVHAGVARTGAGTYRCSAVAHLDRLAEPVDEFVSEVLLAYLAREQLRPAPDIDTGPLAAEAAGLRARIAEAGDLWEDGTITAGEYRARRTRLTEKLEAVETQLADAMGRSALAGLPLGIVELQAAWGALGSDVERRRAIIRATPMTVTIHSPGKGVKRFDPETVTVGWKASDGR
jgi:site-specific DNA recombinase